MFLLFPSLELMQIEDYREELEEMKNMTRQEYVAHLRR
jgi:AP2-like factor (ANT lineage)